MKKNTMKRLSLFVILSLVAPIAIQIGAPTMVEAKANNGKNAQKAAFVAQTQPEEQSVEQAQIRVTKQAKKVVKPSLNVKKVALKQGGDTYQLQVRNVASGSAITWYSTNKKAATVSQTGLITAVGPRTAVIKCRIVTPQKKKITLSCVVTVRYKRPVVVVKITNEMITNGFHVIEIGKPYDFDAQMTPVGEVVWIIGNTTFATVDANGVVTGIAAGETTLTVSPASITLPLGTKVKTDVINIKIVAPVQ